MAVRLPGQGSSQLTSGPQPSGMDALGYEILAEKAAALGRSGEKAERCLRRLAEEEGGGAAREALLSEAANAVYEWFVQRESCGLRRHEEVIRDHAIPRQVLARLGAK